MKKDRNDRSIPCIDCITLSICKAKVHSRKHLLNKIEEVRKSQKRILVRQLAFKCSLFRNYINFTHNNRNPYFTRFTRFTRMERAANFLLKGSENG